MLGNSIQDMQNRMFTMLLITLFPPTFVNAIVPKFHQNMSLWLARELPSRIYGWVPFVTAMVVAEFPISILSATICKSTYCAVVQQLTTFKIGLHGIYLLAYQGRPPSVAMST